MKRVLRLALVLGVIFAAVASSAPAFAHGRYATATSFSVLPKSGPHQLTHKNDLLNLYLKLKGIKLARAGAKPKGGQGHIQIYLDKVPSDSYKTADMKNIASVYPAPNQPKPFTSSYSIEFDSLWIQSHKGNHTLKIALAKNNDVLYRVPIVSFKIDVK